MDIGIIGGADGPTAVFLSADPVGLIIGLVVLAVLVVGAVVLLRRKRK